MFNTSELELHWEPKSPVTLAPELHLTEYVLLNMWTNETIINADLKDLRHGAFGKFNKNQLKSPEKSIKSIKISICSWQLQFVEFHRTFGERDGLLFNGLFLAIDDDRCNIVGIVLVAGRSITATNHARHSNYVDIHYAGIGSRKDFAKSQLYQSIWGVVPRLLSLHFRQSSRICFRQHDMAPEK